MQLGYTYKLVKESVWHISAIHVVLPPMYFCLYDQVTNMRVAILLYGVINRNLIKKKALLIGHF